MLGLATHEPNFTIIREEFKPNKPRPCALCGQIGHEIKDCQGLAREKKGEVTDPSFQSVSLEIDLNSMCDLVVLFYLFQHDEFADTIPVSEQEFIFIRLTVLREVCFTVKKWFTQK